LHLTCRQVADVHVEPIEDNMRRTDKAITNDEALEILMNGEYGVLSTVSADNIPYGVPVNFCYFNDNIYFHSALEGHKLNNITENKNVSFCVVGSTQLQPDKFSTKYESCIMSGIAQEIFDEEKDTALESLVEKYSSQYKIEGREYINKAKHKTRVIKIVPKSITGKAER
jgi:nitroimidazol reductase NimA-like FMN-containing flavoprotein (pyridoxamine 5'-phosphate oxidase superfamily)